MDTSAARAEEHRLFTDDGEIRTLPDGQAVQLIGYRPLRAVQRAECDAT